MDKQNAVCLQTENYIQPKEQNPINYNTDPENMMSERSWSNYYMLYDLFIDKYCLVQIHLFK